MRNPQTETAHHKKVMPDWLKRKGAGARYSLVGDENPPNRNRTSQEGDAGLVEKVRKARYSLEGDESEGGNGPGTRTSQEGEGSEGTVETPEKTRKVKGKKSTKGESKKKVKAGSSRETEGAGFYKVVRKPTAGQVMVYLDSGWFIWSPKKKKKQ